MKKYLPVLKKCPLFDGIGEDDLLRMLTCLGARVEFFDKKYTVMAEGNAARYIGIVLSGAVQIVQVDYYGNRSILGSVGRSQMFAEAFACAEIEALPISVIAGEPGEIMLIDCSHILHTCANNCGFHQQLIFNLMKDLAQKSILFHQKLDILAKRTTKDKLMAYLMLEARRAGSNVFDIPFDRQELADYLEVDRSGLSVEIGKLRAQGVLKSHKKHFELL
ncbi:MAG: Crp/Fnr family transcriptional regulator [Clostridia bacterium]|nr:Crp/Fnr family transcriptional regulator [Clostridia bacterium]